MRAAWGLSAILLASGCLGFGGVPTAPPAPIQAPAPSLPDLLAAGPLDVLRVEYDFGPFPFIVNDPRGVPYPTRIQGSIHLPTAGDGPFPLIAFMHGRHATCGIRGATEILGPVLCPDTPATYNVRSYTGYDYLAEPLARHGYVVVSIDTNNLNDLDASMADSGAVGRAQLIGRTLDELARLNQTAGAPVGDDLVGRIDLSRVGLMGHSRGGEGVSRFISWNADRADGPKHALKAVFALAPTDFGRWPVGNVVHAALLPYCDGDVSNLQGAWMYDDARYAKEAVPMPKIQILAMGSNHNNYNTVWTGDDGFSYREDAHCGPSNPDTSEPGRRLTPDDQRRHGRAYMEAFFRYYVGGEAGFGPLFTGALPPPAWACPAAQPSCEDVLHVSYHAPEGQRLVVEDTMDDATNSTNDLGGTSAFDGFSERTLCKPPRCAPAPRNHGRARMLGLDWEGAATWSLTVPAERKDASAFDALTFRIVVDYLDPKNEGLKRPDVQAALVDTAGQEAVVRAGDHSRALFFPPGGEAARRAVPNEVRLGLDEFSGIDLTSIARIELRFGGKGAVLITDLLLQDEPSS